MNDLGGSILVLVSVYVFVALVLVLGTRWTNALGDDRLSAPNSSLSAQLVSPTVAKADVRDAPHLSESSG